MINKCTQQNRSMYLIAIGIVVFFADAAWGIIFPTLPLYATVLQAPLALTGIIISGLSLLRALGSFPLGILSDIKGRKPVIILGLVSMLMSSISLVAAFDSLQLVPAAMFLGLGHCAAIPIGYAYVADLEASTRKGKAVGIYSTFLGVGLFVGPIIGGFLSESFGYKTAYIASSASLLISLTVAWKTLKKDTKRTLNTPSLSLNYLVKNFMLAMKKKENVVISLAMFIYAVCFSTVAFYSMYAQTLGLSLTLVGSLFTARIFSSTIIKLPIGILSKKIQCVILMILSLIAVGIILFIIPFCTSYFPLLITLSFEGLCYGAVLTSSNILVAERSKVRERGAAIGLLVTSQCAGLTIGPLGFGMIGETWGFTAIFRVASILVFAVVLYLGVNRKLLETPLE